MSEKIEDHVDSVLERFTRNDRIDEDFARIYKILGDRCWDKQSNFSSKLKTKTENSCDFNNTNLAEDPVPLSEYLAYVEKEVIPQSINIYSPRFVGHMTGPLPAFMPELSKVVATLNQNVVKKETSPVLTHIENEVVGTLHRLIYERSEDYYAKYVQSNETRLGVFCSSGSIANITAMAVARNRLLAKFADPIGVEETESIPENCVIVGSAQAHYSFYKAADFLGLGKRNFVALPRTATESICLTQARDLVEKLSQEGRHILAILGIAGTTESGVIDPLNGLADLAESVACYFHVDAAWGFPVLFSDRYKHLLDGIQRADSVTVDAHKQLYVPLGAAGVVFKNGTDLSHIAHFANYSIRKGSGDIGSYTIEGSRPSTALLLHAGFKVIGKKGYEELIELAITKTQRFARMIDASTDFELIGRPTLNILNYRFNPMINDQKLVMNHRQLDRLNTEINKTQIDSDYSFVSRTVVHSSEYGRDVVVFRVVIMNPWTDEKILSSILEEQRMYAIDHHYDLSE